jgi:hypothetical protein
LRFILRIPPKRPPQLKLPQKPNSLSETLTANTPGAATLGFSFSIPLSYHIAIWWIQKNLIVLSGSFFSSPHRIIYLIWHLLSNHRPSEPTKKAYVKCKQQPSQPRFLSMYRKGGT